MSATRLQTAGLAVVAVYLVAQALRGWVDATDILLNVVKPAHIDYSVFRGGGRLLLDGRIDILYDFKAVNAAYEPDLIKDPFFYPPLLAILFAPLATLSIDTGYAVWTGINLLLLAAIALSARAFTRSQLVAGLCFLGAVSFEPVYECLRWGQLALLFTALATAALVLLRLGRDSHAGVAAGLLFLKPQLAVFFVGAGVWRGLHRFWTAAVASAACLVALPFVLVGPDGFRRYVERVQDVGRQAFEQAAPHGGADVMLGWNGFVTRLQDHDPDRVLVAALWVLTLPFVALAWQHKDRLLAFAASIMGALLISPHTLVYDWAVFLPAAFVLATRESAGQLRAVSVGLLLLVHLSVDLSNGAVGRFLDEGETRVLWATLAMYALLVWTSLLPWVEERWAQRQAAALAGATAVHLK